MVPVRTFFVLAVASMCWTVAEPCSKVEYHGLYKSFRVDFTTCGCGKLCPKSMYITNARMTKPRIEAASHWEQNFWYQFKGQDLPKNTGDHSYTFDYEYRCPVLSCKLLCDCDTTVSLTVKIAELQLHAARTDGNVTFTCSSGLKDSREIPIFFNYTSLNGVRIEKKCQPFHSDGWVIYQDTSPPYDCILKVINPDAEDSGLYQCFAVLSSNEYDVSNTETLAVTRSPSKRKSGFPGVIVAIIVVIVLVVVLAIISLVFIMKMTASKCKRAILDEERSPLVSSGGNGSVNRDESEKEVVPVSFATTSSRRGSAREVQVKADVEPEPRGATSEQPVSPGPSNKDNQPAKQNVSGLLSSHGGSASLGGHGSSTPTSTHGKEDLGEEVEAEFLRIKKMTENPSLESTDAPEDPNLKCEYCGKCFQLGQIQHYRNHVSGLCPEAPAKKRRVVLEADFT